MALSKSFFGLRKGSTKSHTYQTYRGMQVTKDRVYDVANPQTRAQMLQRLKLPLVAAARSVLKTLVDHSFEGETYGEPSLKKFSQLNLAKGALTVTSYVPKGSMDTGLANFIIARGSLPEIVGQITDIKNDGRVPTVDTAHDIAIDGFTKADAVASTPLSGAVAQSIANALELQDGDQLTFLLCTLGEEYKYTPNLDEEATANYHQFTIGRLILDFKNGDSKWNVFKSANSEVVSLNDGYIKIKFAIEDGDEMNKGSLYIEKDSDDTVDYASFCVIHSRKNDTTYLRSNARMIVDDTLEGPTFDNVVYSYEKAAAASDRYLNSGLEGVDITGGNV